MSNAPQYTPLVASLPSSVPFVGPETQERTSGRKFVARLGANESVFGPSPKAIAAMQQASKGSWMYGDPENFDLRKALAVKHGVGIENIVVGEGIDGLLGYLARMLVSEGTPVVTSLGAYPTFNFHAEGYGAVLHKVPYVDDREDPDRLLAKAKEVQAPLIYFANPDNPMGTWHPADVVQDMLEALPASALLILDEAYVEFAPGGAVVPIDVSHRCVVRMRTFSKAYGMAGARIGYAVGHVELIEAFNKVRNHFGVNRIGQAGALAALSDNEHLHWVQAQVTQGRQRIGRIASALGMRAIPSATNFVAIDCGRDGAFSTRLLEQLLADGIFVRMPFVSPQDRCIRVSIGEGRDLDAFEGAFRKALETLGGKADPV